MSETAEETFEIEESETAEAEVIEQEGAELQAEAPEQPEAESAEDEIVLEGEDEPASKTVPKGFYKRINKLNGKLEEAHTETSEEKRRNEMLEEENRLLKAKLTGGNREPKPENFDTDEEYEKANRKFQQDQIQAAARSEAQRLYEYGQQQQTQQFVKEQEQQALTAHYERAEKLKVTDYEEVEDIAINTLGKDISRHVMANTGKSQLVMYHLGKNPVKAERLANLIRQNPIQGLIELGELQKGLLVKPKTSTAPEPETELPPGGTVSTSKGLEGVKFE